MALYQITFCMGRAKPEIFTRKRKDSAEYLFRRKAREELIEANAGLDTKWGWDIYKRATSIASDIQRGVPIDFFSELENHYGETLSISRIT